MKVKKLMNKLYLAEFISKRALTSTFVRFEEYYENPKLRGKIFSLADFKIWYKNVFGKFDYFRKWPAFNIPSKVLRPFYNGKFNPLSKYEKKFLKNFRNKKGKFYIIGIYKKTKKENLKHELAHAMFYLYPNYRKEVLKCFRKYKILPIEKALIKKGYSRKVLRDEVNSYVLDNLALLKLKKPKELRKFKSELWEIFKKYYNKF